LSDRVIQKLEGRLSTFLLRPNFDGFTKNDLFIKRFIGKPWGQDIAALSNMAEGFLNLSHQEGAAEKALLHLTKIVELAVHPKVNPYRKELDRVKSLSYHGYYLEHLNTVLGCYALAGGAEHAQLHRAVSKHLVEISLEEQNAHARLIPNVKMRWCADQAAIINSLWLYDKVSGENLHTEPAELWRRYMEDSCRHVTGLFQTEVMNCKRYSKQPRGCSTAYLVHYSNSFAPALAKEQWGLFKHHMLSKVVGFTGFREYLKSFKGRMTPDSGPIIGGLGVAASGLAMKTAAYVGDADTYETLLKSARPLLSTAEVLKAVPGLNLFSAVATDMLATSIQFAALTRASKFYH
jgi:hypothetical protein